VAYCSSGGSVLVAQQFYYSMHWKTQDDPKNSSTGLIPVWTDALGPRVYHPRDGYGNGYGLSSVFNFVLRKSLVQVSCVKCQTLILRGGYLKA
jgi:hypothetical protein